MFQPTPRMTAPEGTSPGGSGGQLPVTNNLKTWGWAVPIWGVILILAGFLIFSGNMFGRVVGVVVTGLNALLQFAYLPHYPFWSFTMILIDVLIIHGPVAHGGRPRPARPQQLGPRVNANGFGHASALSRSSASGR